MVLADCVIIYDDDDDENFCSFVLVISIIALFCGFDVGVEMASAFT